METREDRFMGLALARAQAAAADGETPVGAVIVDPATDQVIAEAANAPIAGHDPTAHAEILAMRDTCEKLGTWRLDNAELIVTLEPCAMCAGALVNARISRVVFGAPDLEAGALGSVYNFSADPRLRHNFEVVHNVLRDECSTALKDFFGELRRARRDGST